MSFLKHKRPGLSAEEYLESEKRTERKNEYLSGLVRELPAGSDVHFAIRMNCAFLLKEHLSSLGDRCRIYVGDMKVQVAGGEAFLYPDMLVTCESEDFERNYFKTSPQVVVEVVAENTAGFDRGRKFAFYRQLPSLREYLLIDADTPEVDCFRLENGRWVLYAYGEHDTLELPSLDFQCEVEDIYQDIFGEEE